MGHVGCDVSRTATGTVLERSKRFLARVSVAPGKRPAILLEAIPACTCRTKLCKRTCAPYAAAVERARIIAALVKRLRDAGYDANVEKTVEATAKASPERLAVIERQIDELITGARESEAGGFKASRKTTFRELAEAWTSGKLHRRYPDHVRLKKTSYDDQKRLEKHVFDHLGDLPIPSVTLDHVEDAMRSLSSDLEATSRKQIAQLIAHVLKLAAYPCRIIAHSPIPRGFLPKKSPPKALEFLYPTEDAALLGCTDVPLVYRMAYGILAREGMRAGELRALTFRDLDLARGAVNLDDNKTDDPRAWALDRGVARALKIWREHFRTGVDESAYVLVEPTPLRGSHAGKTAPRPLNIDRSADRFRTHLKKAGVDRTLLFERSPTRQRIRIHDLRATFVTLSLANDKTETWVADRTGHKSSVMINRYRRTARKAAELNLGALAPLDRAIPELAKVAGELAPQSAPGSRGTSKRGRHHRRKAARRSDSRRLNTSMSRFRFRRRKACGFESRLVHEVLGKKGSEAIGAEGARRPQVPIETASSAHCAGGPRAALVADLSKRLADLAASGDLEGARTLLGTIETLRAQQARRAADAALKELDEDGRDEVIDLASERRRRRDGGRGSE